MTRYQLLKVFHDLLYPDTNEEKAQKFRADTDLFLKDYKLSVDEMTAIKEMDLKKLYRLGVDKYIIINAARFFGVERQDLIRMMKEVAQDG